MIFALKPNIVLNNYGLEISNIVETQGGAPTHPYPPPPPPLFPAATYQLCTAPTYTLTAYFTLN